MIGEKDASMLPTSASAGAIWSVQNLDAFRLKVHIYCRLAGENQKSLADKMNTDRSLLSKKLNGTKLLTYPEIKSILKALTHWGAIQNHNQILELLATLNLTWKFFTPEEWASCPLAMLEETGQTFQAIKGSNPAFGLEFRSAHFG